MKHLLIPAALLALAAPAHAQPCEPAFQAGEPGASGITDPFSAYVSPITFYNNQLILGGSFSVAGPISTNIIAAFNPATQVWSRLGGNVNLGNTNGFAAAINTTFPINGTPNLILGGFYTNVRNGNTNVPNTASLAAWNGTQWSNMNTGWNATNRGSVWALLDWQAAPGDRRLVAGGGWTSIGSATADGIAYYNGTSWANIAGSGDTGISGTFSPTVFALAIYQDQLYIGGRLTGVNGVSTPLVARWNGTVWQRPGALASRTSTSDVTTFLVYDNGSGPKLYAGGYDMGVSGASTSVAAWNGTTWSRIGQNLGGRCTALAAFDDGTGTRLYCGLTADAQEHYVYRLENNTWVPVGGGVSVPISGNFPSVFGMLASGDTLYVGGDFQIAGTVPAYGIARYLSCAVPACPADFNGDGLLNADDLGDYITGYFNLPPDPRCDFNADGVINADDLGDYITAYFNGCA